MAPDKQQIEGFKVWSALNIQILIRIPGLLHDGVQVYECSYRDVNFSKLWHKAKNELEKHGLECIAIEMKNIGKYNQAWLFVVNRSMKLADGRKLFKTQLALNAKTAAPVATTGPYVLGVDPARPKIYFRRYERMLIMKELTEKWRLFYAELQGYPLAQDWMWEGVCVGWCAANGLTLDQGVEFYSEMMKSKLF